MMKKGLNKTIAYFLLVTMLLNNIFLPVDAENVPEENVSITEVDMEETDALLRWTTTDHIGEQCDYVIKELGLSSSQASWLKDGCGIVDGSYSDVAGLHAKQRTNYMACLKAVFLYGQLLGTQDIKQRILASMPNVDGDNKGFVSKVCESLADYLNKKGSISLSQKRYIVYGFGLHLLGDMFAHRTMVKKVNLDKWNQETPDTPTNKYLQNRDFKPDKVQVVKGKILANQMNTGLLKEYMYAKTEHHIYILNYAVDKQEKKENPIYVYEDNKTFMPKRFNAVKKASVSFLTQVRKSVGNFNNVNLYLGEYNLSLHNYDKYKTSIS